ncbi:hypothetical protein H1R20_g9867, partial [Candolleomyces eurysporus]
MSSTSSHISPSNVADYKDEDFQLWTYYMSSRLRAAVKGSVAVRDWSFNLMHPEFFSYLHHEALVLPAISTWRYPPYFRYLHTMIVGVDVLTPEVLGSLVYHAYDPDNIMSDDVLADYKEPWWRALSTIGPVPQRLESLVDCLNAFQEDRCQMVGNEKPIQPLPPVDLEDARKLLSRVQLASYSAANLRIVGLEKLGENLREAGYRIPLKAPTDIIHKAQQQIANPIQKKPTRWELAQRFVLKFGGSLDGTR